MNNNLRYFDQTLLPDGRSFVFWDDRTVYNKIYYVDQNSISASDENDGSISTPFKTIGAAAKYLKPGEKVIINSGCYREFIRPLYGGCGVESMIAYEAAPGAEVVITGTEILNSKWQISEGWALFFASKDRKASERKGIYMTSLELIPFGETNPFSMVNMPDDKCWMAGSTINNTMDALKRPAMVFVDGELLKQADKYDDFSDKEDIWWAEQDGLTLHIRLKDNKDPNGHRIEVTARPQCFAPKEKGLGYIRLSGLKFEKAGNPLPVPQRGIVSASRGHHWIIENCQVEFANTIGIDVGNQSWNSLHVDEDKRGFHIIRGNTVRSCGLCGIAGLSVSGLLCEENIVEQIGWLNIEFIGESAGIKFHGAEDCLIRRNIIKNVKIGCGLWLDYDNKNSRVTRNIFADTVAEGNGSVFVEASRTRNLVDNNLIMNIPLKNGVGGIAIFAFGTEKLEVVNNVIVNAGGAGYFCNASTGTIVFGKGGTGRNSSIIGNIFARCGRAAIEIPNEHAVCDENKYVEMPLAFLRIGTSDRPYSPEEVGIKNVKMACDLETWREYLGFDINGETLGGRLEGDSDSLSLKVSNGDKNIIFSKEAVFEGLLTESVKKVLAE